MAFREREVTGYLVDGDGSPIELAFIKFKPTSPLGYTSSHIIVDSEFTAQTDNTGHFSITLWCDEDSLVAINYNVTFPVVNGGQPDAQHIASFSLQYGDGSPIDLSVAITASIPAPSPEDLLYATIEQIVADEVAAQGGVAIGDGISGAQAGRLPFINAAGQIAQHARLSVDPATGAMKLIDKDYVPLAGSLNADVMFSVASNDNVQNNAGLIDVNNHFVNVATDIKITAHGATKWYIGHYNSLRVGGDYTGSGIIYGQLNQVCNRGNLTGTPYVYGHESSINLEGPATESVGLVGSSFRGSAVACPNLVGGRFIGANGYVNADFVTGAEGWARTVSAGALTTLMRGVWGHVTTTGGHTITEARGLSTEGWVNGGTIENSVGVYIGADVDTGTVSQRAIKSESVAKSTFAGEISVPDDIGNFHNWKDKLEVATKDAVDFSQNVKRRVVLFNDLHYSSGVDSPIQVSNNVAGVWNTNFANPFAYNAFGLLCVNLRANTNTVARIHSASGHSTDIQTYRLGQGRARVINRFALERLSDGVDTFIVRCGHGDKHSVEPANGVYFRYAHDQNAGKWLAVARANNVETTADTGVVAAIGEMKTFEVRVSADGTIAEFFIDGALVATLNANIPTLNTQPVGSMWTLVKSAGVTAALAATCDYQWVEYVFNAVR